VTYNPLTHNQQLNTFNLMDIRIKIGLRIKEFRKTKGLSQEQLALKAEIDRTYMTSVENGKRNVSIQNIEKIVKALEISFEDFFKGI
jgi:transcriptional regulator with XRE-family HTH domain